MLKNRKMKAVTFSVGVGYRYCLQCCEAVASTEMLRLESS